MYTRPSLRSGFLSVLLFLIMTGSLAQAFAAGLVEFTTGGVSATAPDGNARALAKGAQVNSGDTINTAADGRAHIRFTDGAYLSLQPNTIFKIDNYVFNGAIDGRERGVFSLIKGGLRKITGAIGKVNKQNYSVNTEPATIGIRGTAYSALLTDAGLTVSVGQGIVSLTNQSGSLDIAAGQSAFVPNRLTAPTMTQEKVLLPRLEIPSVPPIGKEVIIAEEKSRVLSSTQLSAVSAADLPDIPGTPFTRVGPATPTHVLTSGTGYSVAYAGSDNLGGPIGAQGFPGGNANFDANGVLLDANGGGQNLIFSNGTLQQAAANGPIGWGRWSGDLSNGSGPGARNYIAASNEGIHYVVGTPTVTIPTAGSITYSYLGSTAPTTFLSGPNTTTLGTITPGTMTVNYGITPQPVLLAFLVNTNNGGVYNYDMSQLNGSLSFSGGDFTAALATGVSFCRGGSTTCTVDLKGLVAGPNGERIGFAYEIHESMSGHITKGAITFRKP